MLVTIDRFEGEYAVCEKQDGKMINIKREKVPQQAMEGDVIRIENEIVTIDVQETEKRRIEIEKLVEEIWK